MEGTGHGGRMKGGGSSTHTIQHKNQRPAVRTDLPMGRISSSEGSSSMAENHKKTEGIGGNHPGGMGARKGGQRRK